MVTFRAFARGTGAKTSLKRIKEDFDMFVVVVVKVEGKVMPAVGDQLRLVFIM
jgi:hypothetical protein